MVYKSHSQLESRCQGIMEVGGLFRKKRGELNKNFMEHVWFHSHECECYFDLSLQLSHESAIGRKGRAKENPWMYPESPPHPLLHWLPLLTLYIQDFTCQSGKSCLLSWQQMDTYKIIQTVGVECLRNWWNPKDRDQSNTEILAWYIQ